MPEISISNPAPGAQTIASSLTASGNINCAFADVVQIRGDLIKVGPTGGSPAFIEGVPAVLNAGPPATWTCNFTTYPGGGTTYDNVPVTLVVRALMRDGSEISINVPFMKSGTAGGGGGAVTMTATTPAVGATQINATISTVISIASPIPGTSNVYLIARATSGGGITVVSIGSANFTPGASSTTLAVGLSSAIAAGARYTLVADSLTTPTGGAVGPLAAGFTL